MIDLMNLAERLDACWLDIVSAESEKPSLSVCANLMHETAKALRSAAVPRAMELAPENDGWVLAYVPGRNESLPPWALATRCDGGWCDEEGYGVDPTVWFPLPDPQPAPTGWRKAEGQIRISSAWSEQIPWLTHIIEVVKPDGEADRSREPDLASSLGEARQRASAWADKIGLPVIEADDGNVLPFKRKEPTP